MLYFRMFLVQHDRVSTHTFILIIKIFSCVFLITRTCSASGDSASGLMTTFPAFPVLRIIRGWNSPANMIVPAFQLNNNNHIILSIFVALSWLDHFESSHGLFKECRMSAKWLPTLRPSQPTYAILTTLCPR